MSDFNTAVLNEHDLLYGGVVDLVEENRASARRWARMVELSRRRPDTTGTFAMRGRQWAALEISEVWALNDQHVRSQLNVAVFLIEHLPGVWELCRTGALDRFRATTVADLLRQRLDDPEHWARAGARIERFLRKHLRAYPELGLEMVTCTVTQLRNKLNYEVRCLLTGDEEYQRALADRSVRTYEVEPGIFGLSLTNRTDQVLLARHRLHLGAKALSAGGDERTIDQLMSDLALDLIIGRADDVPVPAYARPIVNVTVPLETLAGVRDDPATLSGGTVIPADLARAIATSEGATWYRLLTDPAGDPVTLSTKSYQPTDAIWRYVVATRPVCAHPTCDRPAVECQLDHKEPYPAGPTDTVNLQPLCQRHHRAKHARAEREDLACEYGLAS